MWETVKNCESGFVCLLWINIFTRLRKVNYYYRISITFKLKRIEGDLAIYFIIYR